MNMARSNWLVGGVAAVAGLGILWTTMAWLSGQFIPHDDRWAVVPGEVTKDGFAHQKKTIKLPSATVAFVDAGQGPPLILLHGCPFSTYEWRDILPKLTNHFRVIAPDLLGLGDTPVRLNQDYRLPTDVTMVRELMGALNIPSAAFIAHDHGGATLQLMMVTDPHLIDKAVMTNVEAYDQWPSKPELPYLRAIVNPVLSPIMYQALQFSTIQRKVFSIAVQNKAMLTPEVAAGYALPHVATPERWQRLRRFFTWQIDEQHNKVTMTALPAMRAFAKPILLVWGEKDDNFGPELARRLTLDIPGIKGISFMKNSKHMPMQEEADAYAAAALAFLKDEYVSPDAISESSNARVAGARK
jgi:pimeloyl-ACP methyl ester carboxylesterase